MNQQQQTTIKVNSRRQIPDDFTGTVEFPNKTIVFHKDGKLHRTDGPAWEWHNGHKEWWIEGKSYFRLDLENFIACSLFLEKQKGKYNLPWLKFLTENEGIQEFPIIPEMNEYQRFAELFQMLNKEIKTATSP